MVKPNPIPPVLPFPLDEAPIVLTTLAADGRYLGSQGSMGLKVFGLRPGERVGQNVFEAWSHRPDVIAHLRKAMSGESFTTTIEIYDRSLFHIFFPIKDENGEVTHLHVVVLDTTETYRDEETPLDRERRLRLQHETLVRLAKSNLLDQLDMAEAYRVVTEIAARLLGVEITGVWFFDEHHSEIVAVDRYDRIKGMHTFGDRLSVVSNPAYFKAIEEQRVIAVSNLSEDPITAPFVPIYAGALKIQGLLDAPIRLGGSVAGIICHETTQPDRIWSIDDKNFAGALGDLLSVALERQARTKANVRLAFRLKLEQLLTSLATSFLDLPPEQVTEAIHRSLGSIGRFCKAQRCFLLLNDPHPSQSIFEWSTSESIAASLLEKREAIFSELLAGVTSPRLFRDLANLRKDTSATPEALFPSGISAGGFVPLIEGGRLLGLLGFHKFDGAGEWEEEIFTLLGITGEMFINALRRKSLDEEMQLHLAILDMVQDAVIVCDTKGRMLFWNDGATTTYGFLREEMIGRSFCHTLGGFTDLARETLEHSGDWSAELQHITKAGTPITVLARFRVMRSSNLLAQSVLIICSDITQQRLLEEQTQRNAKLETLGVLAGGIAHDFNNVLTTISGAVTLANLKPHETTMHLDTASKGLLRARDLTQQFLTFAKGGAPVQTVSSVEKLITETVAFSMHGSRCKVQLDIDHNLYPCEMDSGQMSQVLQNLLINAEQAMTDGGTITVRAFNLNLPSPECSVFNLLPDGRYVKVEVIDQGIGIPDELRKKIFDPYFTTKTSGTGLGLATSFSIIRKHKGDISFTSELGVGTTFRFVLPASDTVEGDECKELSPLPSHHTIAQKVLILDDEPMIRDTLTQMILVLGAGATAVATSDEFIDAYRRSLTETPYDLLIMDLTVPGSLDPRETLKALKALNPEVKVIVSSGYSTDPLMSQHHAFGFHGVMKKPYSFDDLKRSLEGHAIEGQQS